MCLLWDPHQTHVRKLLTSERESTLAESKYLKEAYELWPLEGRYIEAIQENARNADYSSFAFLFVYLPIQLKLHKGS